MLIISLMLMASTSSVLAWDKKTNKSNNSVHKEIPTPEEIRKYAEKTGWSISETQKDLFRGYQVLNNYELIKTEKGQNWEVRYYKPVNNTIDYSVGIQSSEEGNLRVYIEYTPLTGEALFDSDAGYKSELQVKNYTMLANLASSYIFSEPIIGLFTGLVLDQINLGAQGKGDAKSMRRDVRKLGQAYHNGQWQNYFITNQAEWYWSHEQHSYSSTGTLTAVETKYYYPLYNYMPFEWIPTVNFYDDQAILDITLSRYLLGYPAAYDTLDGDYWTSDWNRVGSIAY